MKIQEILKRHFAVLAAIAAGLNLPKEQMVGDEKFQTAIIDAKRVPESEAEVLAALATDFAAHAESTLAEAVKDGTYIPKDAHESAITAAKQTATTEAETKFTTMAEAKAFAAGKRVELATLITAEAAALVSDADLSAETHAATFEKFTARAEKLKASGITVESLPSAFKIVASQKEDAAYEACIAAVVDAFKPGKLTVTASKTEKVAVQGNGEPAKTDLPAFAIA